MLMQDSWGCALSPNYLTSKPPLGRCEWDVKAAISPSERCTTHR